MNSFSKFLLTITALISYLTAAAAKELPSELRGLESRYKKSTAMTARFEQIIHNSSLGRDESSKGRLYIMRPNLFRWETFAPEPSILTSNGRYAWYYTPPFREGEAGQVTKRDAKTIPSKLAVQLLAGRIEAAGKFDISPIKDLEFRLVPLEKQGDLDHIELILESQTKLVYKIRLISKSGNKTEITLLDVDLAPRLSKSMFTFQVPPGTEVIE
jgi:outer membrane lipoprotein carrier protein